MLLQSLSNISVLLCQGGSFQAVETSNMEHGVVIFADHNFAFLTETQEGSLKLRGNLHSYVGLGRKNVT